MGVGEDGGAAIDWFRKWSATDVVVPETFDGRPTTAIGRGASQKLHRLRSIELPASLRRLGSASAENCRLFAECSELTAINVAPGNAVFRSVDGVLYSADGKTLIQVPGGKRGALVVPDGVERRGYCAKRVSRLFVSLNFFRSRGVRRRKIRSREQNSVPTVGATAARVL